MIRMLLYSIMYTVVKMEGENNIFLKCSSSVKKSFDVNIFFCQSQSNPIIPAHEYMGEIFSKLKIKKEEKRVLFEEYYYFSYTLWTHIYWYTS